MRFVPETYTIRLGPRETFLRIRKEPFGCSIFDTKATCECNQSFYDIVLKIIRGRRKSAVTELAEDYQISEEESLEGYAAFLQFFLRKGWITSEKELDIIRLLDHKTLPPLNLETLYTMAPNSIDYHITMRCNLACSHCGFYERMVRDEVTPELTTEEWYHILEQLDANGVMQILITGGEPLLRNDLLDVVSFAARKTNLYIVINTNGILWKEDEVREVAEVTGDRGIMVISLDGHSPETYGTIRKRKDGNSAGEYFENVIETARLAEKYNAQFSFIVVLSKATYWHSLDTVQWILEEFPGASNVNVLRFDLTGETKKGLDLTYKEWKEWLHKATPLKEKHRNRFILSVACGGELYLPLKGDDNVLRVWDNNIVTPLTSEMYRRRRNVGCHAAITDLSIAPDGKIYACGLYTGVPEWYIGDLSYNSFYEIWHHGEDINKFRYLDIEQINAPCSRCETRQLCGGGCRGRAFAATGSIYGPDPYCPYAWRELHE
ncbi:MAG: radical SAM protein [Theionarchaea archaeon]|nr:radical SAM protein [Theionarchaea archaeon]